MNYLSVCSGIEAASLAWQPLGWHRDLAGYRNGRLVAVEPVGRHRGGHVLWLCKCDCGGEKVVQSNNLTREAGTKSCGCLRKEAAEKRRKNHGIWNKGKTYSINDGERVYRSRRAWAKAATRHYGNKCQSCGWAEARCDVHHRLPRSLGGVNTLPNAVVLCPNCHRIEHDQRGVRVAAQQKAVA